MTLAAHSMKASEHPPPVLAAAPGEEYKALLDALDRHHGFTEAAAGGQQ